MSLLHGWSLNRRVFDGLTALLADGVDCTALDLPGHGRHAVSNTGPEDWALPSVATKMLAALPAAPSVLLGWSLGGQIALQIAAQAPQRCEALILICSSAKFVADADEPQGMPPAVAADFRSRLLADVRQAQLDFLDLQVRGSQQAVLSRAALRQALDQEGRASLPTLTVSLDALFTSDLRPLLPAIQPPALVIAGQYDRVTHPAACRRLAEQLPNARYFEVQRAGHAPFLSHPAIVADAIREFLQGL
jgi:pimeloyl-[acyl-carrier protein] methyl ester esterase